MASQCALLLSGPPAYLKRLKLLGSGNFGQVWMSEFQPAGQSNIIIGAEKRVKLQPSRLASSRRRSTISISPWSSGRSQGSGSEAVDFGGGGGDDSDVESDLEGGLIFSSSLSPSPSSSRRSRSGSAVSFGGSGRSAGSGASFSSGSGSSDGGEGDDDEDELTTEQSFYDEVEALKRASNLRVYGAWVEADSENADQPIGVLMMQYVPGYDLSESVVKGHASALSAASLIFYLLERFKVARDNGVIHRDIKPANIKINPETQEFALVDWGLSCFMAKDCSPSRFAGSLPYTSPFFQCFRKTGDRRQWLLAFHESDSPQFTFSLCGAGQGGSRGSRFMGPARGAELNRQDEELLLRNELWAAGATVYEYVMGKPLVDMGSLARSPNAVDFLVRITDPAILEPALEQQLALNSPPGTSSEAIRLVAKWIADLFDLNQHLTVEDYLRAFTTELESAHLPELESTVRRQITLASRPQLAYC